VQWSVEYDLALAVASVSNAVGSVFLKVGVHLLLCDQASKQMQETDVTDTLGMCLAFLL
jgi:sulfur relay (sulfurtransferase) DsrF/TusC family protein